MHKMGWVRGNGADELAAPAGVEPATNCLEGSCSNPLSYGASSARITVMQAMYDATELASMDPLVLMKNLDHCRMTSRRLSYILQQQVHLYTPEANKLRDEIDQYVEAERQLEAEMARRRIRV